MSFHLMLSSEAGKDTYPENHGGDFKVLLNRTIDCKTEAWEVALLEMSLTGQAFPNIPSDKASITVRSFGRPIWENDYIITYAKIFDTYATFRYTKLTASGGQMTMTDIRPIVVRLPQRHYNLRTFK